MTSSIVPPIIQNRLLLPQNVSSCLSKEWVWVGKAALPLMTTSTSLGVLWDVLSHSFPHELALMRWQD